MVTRTILVTNYFGKSESILDEMMVAHICRHQDPLFQSDNGEVYTILEESYAPTIKPYCSRKEDSDVAP